MPQQHTHQHFYGVRLYLFCFFFSSVYFQSVPVAASTISLLMLSLDRYATVKHPRLAQLRQRRFLPTFLAFASWITAICVSVPILLDGGMHYTLSINSTVGLNHTMPVASKLTSAFYHHFILSRFTVFSCDFSVRVLSPGTLWFRSIYSKYIINPFPFWVDFFSLSFRFVLRTKQWQTNQMKRICWIQPNRCVNRIFAEQFKWPTCFSPFTRCWCLFCRVLVWFWIIWVCTISCAHCHWQHGQPMANYRYRCQSCDDQHTWLSLREWQMLSKYCQQTSKHSHKIHMHFQKCVVKWIVIRWNSPFFLV